MRNYSTTGFALALCAAVMLASMTAKAQTMAPFPPGTPGWAVETNGSETSTGGTSKYDPTAPVVRVWDITNPGAHTGGLPAPAVWKAAQPPMFTPIHNNSYLWSAQNLGQVFGIAIDSDPNDANAPYIYVTATAIYGSTTTPTVAIPPTNGCTGDNTPAPWCFPGATSLSTIPSVGPQPCPWTIPWASACDPANPFMVLPGPPGGAFALNPQLNSGNPVYGAVWRLSLGANLLPAIPSASMGTYELAAIIPISNQMSLGQIAYNAGAKEFYVSNFADGRIYMFTNGGPGSPTVTSGFATYDHGIAGRAAASLPTIPYQSAHAFADYGRRVWALEYNAQDNRLYYAVWNADYRNQTGLSPNSDMNQIWSVALGANGLPIPNSAKKEFDIPAYPNGLPPGSNPNVPPATFVNYSQPVSHIAFNQAGDVMLLAERGERIGRNFYPGYDYGTFSNSILPHNSRILRYRKNSSPGNWVLDTANNYGEYDGDWDGNGSGAPLFAKRTNSGGGVDFGYDYKKDPNVPHNNLILEPLVPDGWAWATVNSYHTLQPAGPIVYGLQGARMPVPDAGGAALTPGNDVYYVDWDDNYIAYPKTMVGDVKIHRRGVLNICKTTQGAGGKGFEFQWKDVPHQQNHGIFSLDDGGCQTLSVPDAGIMVNENVPPAYKLTNIVCKPITNVAIGGANPNPAFQLGDFVVLVSQSPYDVTCTFTNKQSKEIASLSVTKIVKPDPYGVGGLFSFQIGLTCGSYSHQFTLHGNTSLFPPITNLAGPCQLTETLPHAFAHGGLICTWNQPAYSPSSNPTLTMGGNLVTITNSYTCAVPCPNCNPTKQSAQPPEAASPTADCPRRTQSDKKTDRCAKSDGADSSPR